MTSQSSVCCKVSYCRFSNTHVTKGHRCGVCGKYGHGEIECKNHFAIYNLQEKYHSDVLPEDRMCTVLDCNDKAYHTVEAHHCSNCGKRELHTKDNCPYLKNYKAQCPLCRTENIITEPKKILGLSDKCSICLDNDVHILFPNCSHCCVCSDCFHKMASQL